MHTGIEQNFGNSYYPRYDAGNRNLEKNTIYNIPENAVDEVSKYGINEYNNKNDRTENPNVNQSQPGLEKIPEQGSRIDPATGNVVTVAMGGFVGSSFGFGGWWEFME